MPKFQKQDKKGLANPNAIIVRLLKSNEDDSHSLLLSDFFFFDDDGDDYQKAFGETRDAVASKFNEVVELIKTKQGEPAYCGNIGDKNSQSGQTLDIKLRFGRSVNVSCICTSLTSTKKCPLSCNLV